MSKRVFNLPNVISMLRLVAVPVVAGLILHRQWEAACWLFLAAALSDGLDGLLALVLGSLAGLLAAGVWLDWLFAGVFAIAAASGVQYVWIWGAKARRERVI